MRLGELGPLILACSASALPVLTLPWFGHITLDNIVGYLGYVSDLVEERTIYQVLKDDTQYSRLVEAIDLCESAVDLLSDPSRSITFFAVPNSKFPHYGHRGHDEGLIPSLADNPRDATHVLGNLVRRVEELEKEPDSSDKKKHREVLASIVHKIIAYHILPEKYETADLVRNSTYATNLTLDDGSLDWEPLRLNVLSNLVPPRVRINIFTEVTKKDVKAKNGVIHEISKPLLPPPSVFQETFSAPEVFSFFTTAIQHAGLTDAIDRRKYSKDNGQEVGFLGERATTAFAPTSDAFKHLPRKLRSYLFSPFGQKALKKLLEYHIVPNFVFYTDYFHNSTSHVMALDYCLDNTLEAQFSVPLPTTLLDGDVEDLVLSRNIAPVPTLVYEYNATLPTLVQGHHLRVHIARYKSGFRVPGLPIPGFPRYITVFKVNDHVVPLFDVPARNGALHVLSTILDPRKGCDNRGGDRWAEENDQIAWEDWEEWLPQWAMEN